MILMSKIFKYPIMLGDNLLDMPIGSEILCVQMQNNKPMIWANTNTNNKKELRKIKVFGTGHEFNNSNLTYIGTFQELGGNLIWHVFEEHNI